MVLVVALGGAVFVLRYIGFDDMDEGEWWLLAVGGCLPFVLFLTVLLLGNPSADFRDYF